ncbi:hypothetical protein B0H19DRAFT_1254191 [Mycena capillaripes]|nr:hypothetical protein B0H19DRAFT_1276722 [Mycena capillaripes]KAJ6574489.1 hypothetical protein B0H19DRAFT_1254191 [Mycena capillaripes]
MSRAPSSEIDDDLAQAMAQSSPVRPTAASKKRSHGELDPDSDQENGNLPAGPSGAVNQNFAALVQRFATQKRLRPEQKTELGVFMKDPPSVREAKLFVQNLYFENLVNKIIVSAPPWEVSDNLHKNIYSYGAAALLSALLPAYKGNIPKNILFAILKKHRFDLPAGIEHNPANWAKVRTAVEGALTQLRSKFKKLITKSVQKSPKDKALLPKSQRKSIFALTQIMVEKTECDVNVLLCARVALMRKAFLIQSGPTFWDTVDSELEKIRAAAKGDAKAVSRGFRHILKIDRATHGVDDYEIDDTIDTFQQEVDDIIDAGAATAVAGGGDDDDDDEEAA